MSEKRTKSDKVQRQANRLEEKDSRRPDQGEEKKTTDDSLTDRLSEAVKGRSRD